MRWVIAVVLQACGWLAAIPSYADTERSIVTSAEAAYTHAPARHSTLLNPAPPLIDADRRGYSMSLHSRAKVEAPAWSLRADTWLEADRDQVRDTFGSAVIVPEAYAEARPADNIALSGGVSLFKWGTGYVWNPANPLADPQANNTSRARPYRRDGDPFFGYEQTFGRDLLGVYAVNFRQNDPLLDSQRDRHPLLAVRYQTVLEASDIALFASVGQGEHFVGSAVSATVSQQLELHGELGVRSHRRAPSIEFAPIPLPGATQALPVWRFEPRREYTAGLLAGGQYTFENDTNLIVEYFFNGNGLSGGEYDRLREAAKTSRTLLDNALLDAPARGFLLEANRITGRLRRNYLFARITRDGLFKNTDFHYFAQLGIDDSSIVQGGLLRYSFSPRLRAQLSGEFYNGPHASEALLIPVRRRIEFTLSYDF